MLRPPGAAPSAQRHLPAALAAAPGGAGAQPPPRAPVDLMSHAKQLGIGELQAPQARREGFRALLPTPGGPLLTGGTDRIVRLWDGGRPAASYVVCCPPPPVPASQPGAAAAADPSSVTQVDLPRYTYSTRSVHSVPVVEESVALERSASSGPAADQQHLSRMGWAERAAATAHQQAVTDLARVQASEPLLLSCSQDGLIKAWR